MIRQAQTAFTIYCKKHGVQIPNPTGPACPQCATEIQTRPARASTEKKEYLTRSWYEIVDVWEDPITRTKLEGRARVVSGRKGSHGEGLGLYYIHFISDGFGESDYLRAIEEVVE